MRSLTRELERVFGLSLERRIAALVTEIEIYANTEEGQLAGCTGSCSACRAQNGCVAWDELDGLHTVPSLDAEAFPEDYEDD